MSYHGKPSAYRARNMGSQQALHHVLPVADNWYARSYHAMCLVLKCQHWDWLAWCQYTVTGWDSKFDLQLLSQRGSTQNCQSRSVHETHFGWCSYTKQLKNKSRVSDQNGASLLYIMLEIHQSGRGTLAINIDLSTGMPLDFCENNWKSTCACRLTENEHKKRQKVQKEKDEIGENRE